MRPQLPRPPRAGAQLGEISQGQGVKMGPRREAERLQPIAHELLLGPGFVHLRVGPWLVLPRGRGEEGGDSEAGKRSQLPAWQGALLSTGLEGVTTSVVLGSAGRA